MNKKNLLVSIIIPTLNRGSLLVETLNSVYQQTYKNFEVIVVDSNSTDNTQELLKPFLAKDNFRIIVKNIKNISQSRNIGIAEAKGELIAFLDSDDLWIPEKLEKQIIKFREKPTAGLIYSNGITFYDDGRPPHPYMSGNLDTGNIFNKLYSQGNWIPTSSILVKKEVLETTGVFDESLTVNEDIDLLLRIAHKYKIDCVKEPLIKYRVPFLRASKDRQQMKNFLRKVKEKYKNWL